MAEHGKSYGYLENLIPAIDFISGFLNYPSPSCSKSVISIKLFLAKYCIMKKRKSDGFQRKHLNELWEKLLDNGFEKLSKVVFRNFVLSIFVTTHWQDMIVQQILHLMMLKLKKMLLQLLCPSQKLIN